MIRRLELIGAAAIAMLVLAAQPSLAQEINFDLGTSGSLTGRIFQIVALVTVLTLAPSLLVTMTSFTRIVIVLSLMRSAIGVQQTRPT